MTAELGVATPGSVTPAAAGTVGASSRRAGKGRWVDAAASATTLVLVLGLWQLSSHQEWVSPVMLPPALDVLSALWSLLSAEWFATHVWITVQETLIGFGLAATVAVALAVTMHLVPLVRRIFYPYVIVFKLIPAVVLAPVYLVWFGFGMTPKVLVAASIAFFVIFVSALAGLDSVSEEMGLLMRSLGASKTKSLRLVDIHLSAPFVFSGLRTGITLSLVGALVAEFMQANKGLGSLLVRYGYSFQQDLVFATIIVIACLGLVLFGLIILLERRILWWCQ